MHTAAQIPQLSHCVVATPYHLGLQMYLIDLLQCHFISFHLVMIAFKSALMGVIALHALWRDSCMWALMRKLFIVTIVY